MWLIPISKAANSVALCFLTFSRCQFSRFFPSKSTLPSPHFPQHCCTTLESADHSFVYKYYGNSRSSGKSKISCQEIEHKAGTVKALWTPGLTGRVLRISASHSQASTAPWFSGHFHLQRPHIPLLRDIYKLFLLPVTALQFSSRSSLKGFSAFFWWSDFNGTAHQMWFFTVSLSPSLHLFSLFVHPVMRVQV